MDSGPAGRSRVPAPESCRSGPRRRRDALRAEWRRCLSEREIAHQANEARPIRINGNRLLVLQPFLGRRTTQAAPPTTDPSATDHIERI